MKVNLPAENKNLFPQISMNEAAGVPELTSRENLEVEKKRKCIPQALPLIKSTTSLQNSISINEAAGVPELTSRENLEVEKKEVYSPSVAPDKVNCFVCRILRVTSTCQS
ncbi:hypothetical protein CEXT_174801 [Caerostris extrusa]|uniref:Uncharacterized protein n=1 Tax=Caerostris extrusa TaxID=172846 RepID=A0AAV4UJU7_CAEEX|nr:hypothetical protein CEXT_174801 [Caerostris extrusa]